jgi:hypothetical protein
MPRKLAGQQGVDQATRLMGQDLSRRIAKLEWNPPRGFQAAATVPASPVSILTTATGNLTNSLSFATVAGRKYEVKIKARAIATAAGTPNGIYIALWTDGVQGNDGHQIAPTVGYASIFMEATFNGDGATHTYQAKLTNGTSGTVSVFMDGSTSGLEIHDTGPVTPI